MPIDLHLDADPSQIEASEIDVGDVVTALDKAEDEVIRAKSRIGGLTSEAADEALKELNNIVHDCQDLIADLKKYKTVLGNLAGDLRSVKSRLDGIREKAVAARLDIEDEKIMEPKPPTVIELGPAMGKLKDPTVPFPSILSRNTMTEAERAQARVDAYNGLVVEAREVRDREAAARQEFTDACAGIRKENPITKTIGDFLAPSLGLDPKSLMRTAGWGISRLKNVSNLVTGAALRSSGAGLGRVTGYAHKWLPYRVDTSRWSGKLFAGALKHWSPHPAEAVGTTAGKVATTLQSSRVTTTLKWAGRAGNALSFAVSAYDQWEKDSHNPAIGENEKIARATASGAANFAVSYLAATGGAKTGAAIGACMGGPLGAAVGGIVGGVVGGVLASGVAASVGKAAAKFVSGLGKSLGKLFG
jgi:surface antigen